ncbi:MAG TPA: YkgJ family cysteine cluster protein [Gemmataceae bacterium]|jgi:lysine-N-methylase
MPWPVRNLPVIQNWDCHGCGECCREYEVHVTEAERQRILAQGWEDDPAVGGTPLFVRTGPWWRRRWRLNTRPGDDACVFLNEQGRCRIHAKFGGPAKPLACQVYPFTLNPAGDHWRVGIRFACPSVTDNLGRPVSAHRDDLRAYGQGLEEREGVKDRSTAPPPLQAGQRVPWSDVEQFARALLTILGRSDEPIEYRLRQCLALSAVCRQAKFDKVSGKRLGEFLDLVTNTLTDIEHEPAKVAPPGWVGRILFRQAVAVYARRDTGPRQGISKYGRVALLAAAWRFARGTGQVPRVHGLLPEATFERLEEPAGPLPEASERLLGRYYRLKVESYQFFGPTNFNAGFWEGFESLLLTFPATMWLARMFQDRPREQAIAQALRIVDDNFGYNRLLGTRRQRLSVRLLAARGELAKLIAWYAR